MHNHTHNTPHYTSSQSNTQSPASHQHSQSTIHVQTPTLRINAPHFQPNLHQPLPHHEVNHIDIIQGEDEVEINEAHMKNPNYKGKNYDPNYQQNRTKMNTNMLTHTTSSQHNTGNQGHGYNKNNQQDKPVNVSITLHGPVSKEQLYKIQEVLRHPSQYRDRIKPEDHPATGEYANAFNKFRPKKVEVNKATIEEAIKYGHFLKRSKEDIAEAIDIYKTLGNETFYGPEEEKPADQQEQPKQ